MPLADDPGVDVGAEGEERRTRVVGSTASDLDEDGRKKRGPAFAGIGECLID